LPSHDFLLPLGLHTSIVGVADQPMSDYWEIERVDILSIIAIKV
jgi:hypothetical protein